MKNWYIAMSINEEGKQYAYVLKFSKCNNLLNINSYKNVEFALLCETKKRATQIVNSWNVSYKTNGTYMF